MLNFLINFLTTHILHDYMKIMKQQCIFNLNFGNSEIVKTPVEDF